jgi:photosystem II stability/assembly factor-like uncharacterized protein
MSREILVATASGLVLDGEVVALSGRDVTGLVHAGDGGWFAVTDRSEIHAITRDWSVESLATAPGVDAIGMLGGHPVVGTEGWVVARDGLAAVVTPEGTVFASTDAGRSWERAFAVTEPRQLALTPDYRRENDETRNAALEQSA